MLNISESVLTCSHSYDTARILEVYRSLAAHRLSNRAVVGGFGYASGLRYGDEEYTGSLLSLGGLDVHVFCPRRAVAF